MSVVRCGSITAAAQELALSKSGVSHKLTEMERDLDVILLKRTTRSLKLTTAGKSIYALCARAVDAVHEASHDLNLPGDRIDIPAGTVNISGSNIYLTRFVLPALESFLDSHPAIRVNLIGNDTPADLQENDIDLRIRVGPFQSPGFRVFPLAPLKRLLCISSYFEAESESLSHPQEISGLPLVLREQEKDVWSFEKGRETAEITLPRPRLKVNSYELCLEAVRKGYGAAILTEQVVREDLETGRIVSILPEWTIRDIPVSLIARYSRLKKPHVQLLAGYLAEQLK